VFAWAPLADVIEASLLVAEARASHCLGRPPPMSPLTAPGQPLPPALLWHALGAKGNWCAASPRCRSSSAPTPRRCGRRPQPLLCMSCLGGRGWEGCRMPGLGLGSDADALRCLRGSPQGGRGVGNPGQLVHMVDHGPYLLETFKATAPRGWETSGSPPPQQPLPHKGMSRTEAMTPTPCGPPTSRAG
jgi:hypothetical protein